MKPHTFGKSDACVTLTRILIERGDKKELNKVARFLNEFNTTLNDLTFLKTRGKFYVAKLLYHDVRLRCDSFPNEYKSFVNCVITYHYREWLKANDYLKPNKFR